MTNTASDQTTPVGTLEHQARLRQRADTLRALLTQILPTSEPLTWELGCGHGHFLTAYARAHPERLCIGLDIVSERIERALRKRDRAKLENLHFIHAEGRLFLETLPAGVHASELFILFPDPWPKARHHKHRILRPDFLTAAADRMTENSKLCFRTDYQPYFEDASRCVSNHPRWSLTHESWPFEFSTVFQSRAPTHQSLIARRNRTPADT